MIKRVTRRMKRYVERNTGQMKQSANKYSFKSTGMGKLSKHCLFTCLSHYTDLCFNHTDISAIFIIVMNQPTLQQSSLKLCNSNCHICHPYIFENLLYFCFYSYSSTEKCTSHKMFSNSPDNDYIDPNP